MASEQDFRQFSVGAIPTLVNRLTPVQKNFLNALWERHVEKGLPYPRIALTQITPTLADEEVLNGLNGCLVYEKSTQGNSTAYQLTFYGALLTKDGERLVQIFRQLLNIIQTAHKSDPFAEKLSKDDVDRLANQSDTERRLTPQDFQLLFKLLALDVPPTIPFYLDGYGDDGLSWSIAIKPEVRQLYLTKDVDKYLDACLAADYDPDEPIRSLDRVYYHRSPRGGSNEPVDSGLNTHALNSPAMGGRSRQRQGSTADAGLTASSRLTATRTETEAAYDLLGREKVTQALRHLLLEREDTKPFAIGLFGHWGAGKSSQIGFLLEEIAESEPRILVAEYNAWRNEEATNIGAMLAQAVVDGLVADLGILKRFWLALRLAALSNRHTRKAARSGWYLPSVWLRWVWPIVPYISVLILLMWLLWWVRAGAIKWPVLFATPVLGAYHFIRAHLTEWFKHIDLKKSAALLAFPDYSAHRGLALEIHRTLEDLCALCLDGGEAPKKGKYLLLVVDDLDRCSVEGVKEVLDAIRLVANIPRVVTLVAMDERIAFAAVEKHYENSGHGGREQELVARDYLGKVLQVSITLPEVNYDGISHYVDNKIFIDLEPPRIAEPEIKDKDAADFGVNAAHIGERTQANESPASSPKETAAALSSLPDEKILFKALARAYGFSNPRLLWRLYMAWKLLKALRLGDVYGYGEVEPLMRMLFWREWIHQQERKKREQYSDWIAGGAVQDGIDEPPPEIVEVVEGELRKKWDERKPLVSVVDTVLLPFNPAYGVAD